MNMERQIVFRETERLKDYKRPTLKDTCLICPTRTADHPSELQKMD